MAKYKSIDSILIDQPTDPSIRDAAMDSLSKEKAPKLKVTIDATYSGVLTNRRVYPGVKVRDGYRSFFDKKNGGSAEFDKPVLKHHNSYDDPIGRVISASFSQFKQGQDFEKDFLAPDNTGGKGSGVVTIVANISDAESIQKIIDGRYLSVSAGHETNSMTCSICGKSIAKCDHWPGKFYNEEGEETDAEDGFMCYYITGDMQYNEISFVNMPAQPPAKLINFKWEDFQKDQFEKENSLLIQSMTRGKKSMVRDLLLTDEDGEYNLIKGLYVKAGDKTVVAMKQQTEIQEDEKETKNVPLDKTGDASGDAKIAKNILTKDNKAMDEDKNKDTSLDAKTLQASLQALTSAKEKIEQDKAKVDQKLVEVEANLASKTSEIERLTKSLTDTQVELSQALATALTSFRIKLGKPGTEELTDSAKFDEYVKKLSERTPSSLKDSIADIIIELKNGDSQKTEDEDSKDLSSTSKVKSPLQVDTKNKLIVAGKEVPSKTTEKTAIDKVFE